MVVKKNKLIPSGLRSSESFQEDFKVLLSLTDGQISKLAEFGASEDGFYFPEELIDKAASDLQIEYEEVSSAVRVVRYLYRRASTEETYEKGAEEVCDFAKSIGIKDCDQKVSAIRRLLTRNEAFEHSSLVAYTESIAAPTISDVDVVCDVRAVVDPRSDEVVGYVPIALLGIEVEHSESDKRTMTLQLSETDLDSLLDDLNKAKQLLRSLKEKFGGEKS